jgi:hypothetical protein
MMFVPRRKHTYGPPRPVRKVALFLYIEMMFVPHRKRSYGTQQPVTVIVLLIFVTWQSLKIYEWEISDWKGLDATCGGFIEIIFRLRDSSDNLNQDNGPILKCSDDAV